LMLIRKCFVIFYQALNFFVYNYNSRIQFFYQFFNRLLFF
jgi:hypothetical protein